MSIATRIKDAKNVGQHCTAASKMFKTLANPLRLSILCVLVEGEKSVGEIEGLCDASQSQVSQFLKRMEYERMVEGRRDGKCIYYSIIDERIYKIFKTMHEIFKS